MRVLTAEQQENINTQKFNRILSLYDRGLMVSKEVGAELKKENIITVKTMMEEGKLPPQPVPPNGPMSVAPVETAVTPKKGE